MAHRRKRATVTIRNLSRNPARVLDRVARGESLIVCRHRIPVAILQPLGGAILERLPDSTSAFVWRDESEAFRVETLSDVERALLTSAVRLDMIKPLRIRDRFDLSSAVAALEDMALRGLVKKIERGWVLKGRGMMLRDVLLAEEGADEPNRHKLST